MKLLLQKFQVSAALLVMAALPASAINQQGQAAQPIYLQNASNAGPLAEINKLLDAKVEVEVIKAYIQNCPVAFRLTAADIIALKDRGAPPEILKALVEHQPQTSVTSVPTVQAPMAPPAYSSPQTAPYPAYSYPDYGYDYSYPYSYDYPSYYPAYSYYNYGWPYFYFGLSRPYCYPRYNYCYGYGGRGYRYPYGYSHFGGGFRTFGSGLVATRPGFGGFSGSGHFGGFHGSIGFPTSGGFHGSGSVGGGFHGGGSGGFHGGGGGGFHGGGGGHSGGHR